MAGINLSSLTSEHKSEGGGIFDSSATVVTIVFFLVVAGFGGLRWYIKTLDTKVAALDGTLEENALQLQGKNVDRVAHFDNRLTLVEKQLEGRVDSQKLLNQLESLVIPSVKLTKYEYNEVGKFVEVNGETDSFKYVAQQIISFKSEDLFTGIRVQSLTHTEVGRVAFSLKAEF